MAPGGYSQSYDFWRWFRDKCQNGHCVNRIYRQYTHTFTYTQICAHICYKRHFFRCSTNKKIWHLEAIRRAMIFWRWFRDKCRQNGHCVNRIYRQYTHTFTYTQICAHICYKLHFFRCSANKKIWHLEAIRRAMIFWRWFRDKCQQNGHCVNRIYRQYTHTFTYTEICAHICYKRHFFRCSANKKIWHLEAIRRAMIFWRWFRDKCWQNGHCVNRIYRQYTHTHSHTRRSVRIFAINVTFFAALRIRKYGTWRLLAELWFLTLISW